MAHLLVSGGNRVASASSNFGSVYNGEMPMLLLISATEVMSSSLGVLIEAETETLLE